MMRRSLLSSLFVLIAITPLPASPQVNLADYEPALASRGRTAQQ
jgi:hypothetical protein